MEKLIQSIFVFLTASILVSQSRIGDWESYTSPLIIHDLIELDSKVLCATEGGLLIYDIASEEFSTLTNIDGLIGTNLNVIEKDLYGNIWLGGALPNGFIQVYNPSESSSIAEFDYDLTEIIDIAVGDTIVFAVYQLNQDFGIQKFLYDGNRWSHNDLMVSDWLFESEQIAGIVVWNDSVFVGTNQGLYRGNFQEDPHAWSEELTGNISSILLIQDELLIVKDNFPYRINLNTMEDSLIQSNFSVVKFVKSFNNELWGIRFDGTALVHLESNLEIPVSHTLNVLIPLIDGSLAGGTEAGIVLLNSETQEVQQFIPNAPLTNQFTAVTVLDDGRVVAGSKYGLAIKEDWGWRNIVETTGSDTIIHDQFHDNRFAADTIPVDFGGFITDLEQGPDDLLYCAVWGTYPEPRRHGGGIIIIDIDNPENFTLIDTSILDYFQDEYMVVKDLEFDQNDNLWIANRVGQTRKIPINIREVNGNWGYYSADSAENVLGLAINSITIDSWDRVWTGANTIQGDWGDYSNGGLAMLYYSGHPSNPDHYQWTGVDISPENSNNKVWSLAVTSGNRLYALTPIGLSYFDLRSSSENPVLKRGPQSTAGELFTYFPNISFGTGSRIKLDTHENAWTTSPSDGIHVLLANATYWPDDDPNLSVEGITTETSHILSNEVTDVAFDNEQGLAYITTKQGLNAFRIPFSTPKKIYTSFKVFPSPFHVPSQKPLIIDGLIDKSSLMVMTITGTVIRHIRDADMINHGYQIKWDGRDEEGRWVGSGVYLLSVYNLNGESGYGKITIIRH